MLYENTTVKNQSKKILILTDGIVGHEKQSFALAKLINPTRKIKTFHASFKSCVHYFFFSFICSYVYSRKGICFILKQGLLKNVYNNILSYDPDIIISAGSKTSALNVALSRLKKAKNVYILKPMWGRWKDYSLLIIPQHDSAPSRKNIIKLPFSLSSITPESLLKSKLNFATKYPLSDSKYISIFIGGTNSYFKITKMWVNHLIESMQSIYEKGEYKFLITTSRRTPANVSQLLKKKVSGHSACSFLYIFNDMTKNPIENIVESFLEISDIVIVTEDSISMISDAVFANKKIIVLKIINKNCKLLSNKFKKFISYLKEYEYIDYLPVNTLPIYFLNKKIESFSEPFNLSRAPILKIKNYLEKNL